MQAIGQFQDGETATVHQIACYSDRDADIPSLVIISDDEHVELARWPIEELRVLPFVQGQMRLSRINSTSGARLIFNGRSVELIKQMLPELAQIQKKASRGQFGIIAGATAALVSVVVAYIFGVPLLAGRIAVLLPIEWETNLGKTAGEQFEAALTDGGRFKVCNSEPDSEVNQLLSTFVARALEQEDGPFKVNVSIVDFDMVNAFALPGGQIFYFSGLLDEARSVDEFAGVLTHEIGHVVHRHTTEKLIASAGTGLLVGMILGDISGFSVAAAVGTVLIDSRFSREAETVADKFAVTSLHRLGLQPNALGDLLDRVAADDQVTAALSILGNHPLTAERRTAMKALEFGSDVVEPVLTTADWEIIRTACDS